MGQKINASGLRLKKKINWNTTYCTHNFQHFSKILVSAQQIRTATNILLSKVQTTPNNLFLTRDSKSFRLVSKLLQKHVLFKNTFLYNVKTDARVNIKTTTTHGLKHFSQPYEHLKYIFSNILSKTRDKNNTKDKSWRSRRKKDFSNFPVLSPKVVTSYIRFLLNRSANPRFGFTSSNLASGIPVFLRRLFLQFKHLPLGVKIICSGRWKKTRSGRKQKLCIKYGKVRSSTLSNVVLFDYDTQKTKFGSCGIKVWISHKRVKNSFYFSQKL